MADMDDAKRIHQLNGALYRALMKKKPKDVLGCFKSLPDDEGPLYKITIHKDTVLHMACYSKQRDLALELLQLLPPSLNQRLANTKNDVDNTILHEVATYNAMTDVATEILNRAPELLTARNILGETPLFRAVRYGKDEMFKLLAEKLDRMDFETEEDCKACLRRNDGTTILHISVFTENFDMALLIAERYGDLISAWDSNQMTALQHLACCPSAFLSGCEHGHLRRFIYSCIVSLFSSPLTGLIKFFWHCYNFHKAFRMCPNTLKSC
ncbi:uncharacterized protein LOC132252516 [Vitis vinifera]|uniref:uncharacterized protein LOC132252516 n=1 Tax=Vitis vinifera TaxID=29760 RepID=UPI0028832D3F|nr:uncharacterized protein LOC132252516 [Vitis vinifera]